MPRGDKRAKYITTGHWTTIEGQRAVHQAYARAEAYASRIKGKGTPRVITVEDSRAYATRILKETGGKGELGRMALELLDAVEGYDALKLELEGDMSAVEALMGEVFP